jgi:benzoyl-CoA reductase/2-hydroxyglutaryl-CoA dehydratase subunit BcrC/BadD/HgdB
MTIKSASPTVRALDELKNRHMTEIARMRNEEYSRNESEISKIRKSHVRDTITKANAALRSLDVPFALVEKDACNISQYDHSLRFDMVFDPSKDKAASKLATVNRSILAARKKSNEQLDKWYTNGLYQIASRLPIPRFLI